MGSAIQVGFRSVKSRGRAASLSELFFPMGSPSFAIFYMADHCVICDTRRPVGGTNILLLNEGKFWLEFCSSDWCLSAPITNAETGEVVSVETLWNRAKGEPDGRVAREPVPCCSQDDWDDWGGHEDPWMQAQMDAEAEHEDVELQPTVYELWAEDFLRIGVFKYA